MSKTKKYVLCISGSRSLDDYSLIERAVAYANIDLAEVKEIIAGGAKGVDKNAERFAEFHKIKFKEYPADWKNIKAPGATVKQNSYGSYNSRAGFDRNQKMAEKADRLLALWDGKSNGTQHEIECFKKLGKEYTVYQDDSNKSQENSKKSTKVVYNSSGDAIISKDKDKKDKAEQDFFKF